MNAVDLERSWTTAALREQLKSRHMSSAELVGDALHNARDRRGEGARTFTCLYEDSAPVDARRADRLGYADSSDAPLRGLPVSIKDSFDVAGEITTAGSYVLRREAPATTDSFVVARLESKGAVLVGRTNMSEFGLSGLGSNDHWGTPANPYDRHTGRLPGGSSSGAAVVVADRMAVASVCSDTGGSARVPAALCGLVGFKPTAGRISRAGLFPLSPSCDSVGLIAPTVDCCMALDEALADDAAPLDKARLTGLRLGVPEALRANCEPAVARAFERALAVLSAAGVIIDERPVPRLRDIDHTGILGGILAYEAYRSHGPFIERYASLYEPGSLGTIATGASLSPLQHASLLRQRYIEARALEEAFRYCDFIAMPTVPVVAPPLAILNGSAAERELLNGRLLETSSLVNFMDWCAVSIPCNRPGDAPVGFTIAGKGQSDRMLLRTAGLLEDRLAANEEIEHAAVAE